MGKAVRTAWNANRHWVAAGFLASTSLFLLLMFLYWRNEQYGIASQKASGLASSIWGSVSVLQQTSVLPLSRTATKLEATASYPGGTLGGVPRTVDRSAVEMQQMQLAPSQESDKQVILSGTLEIIVTDPLHAAEHLHNLATHLSGFVVSSKVSGNDEQTRSAQVTMRIPASYFDEARAQVRTIANSVEQDTSEARDVTREYVDQQATLRNSRAEEVQYLTILKHATAVKDILEVSSKLAEVRGRIDEQEADLSFLRHQVEMSLLTVDMTALVEAQVFGIRWRPLYKAKLSLRGALSAIADYGDSMVELLVNLPVLAIWSFTILALLKAGWMVLRRIVVLFFPALGTWLRRPAQPQAVKY